MKKLHAAIAGAGFMGCTHVEALRRLGIQITGILGITPQEGQSVNAKLGLPKVYLTFEDLCSDPEVNIVHLCVPNYLHYPMAKAALNAGKHVICEKPLSTTSQEAWELVELTQKLNLVGAVNYNLRYYPLCQEAHARVRAGEIGEVRILHGGYCQDWLFLATDWNWRLEPEFGGALRVVADIGSHCMDMATWISGLEIQAVMADFATFHPIRYQPTKEVATFAGKLTQDQQGQPVEVNTEDYASVLFRLQNGARGAVVLSQVSAGRKNHFWWEINGSKASLSWHQENPNELWIGWREQPNQWLIKDPALMSTQGRKYAAFPGGHAEGYPDTFVRLFDEVYSYIESGNLTDQPTFPTFIDGWKEMVWCEAIRRSARENQWIEIE